MSSFVQGYTFDDVLLIPKNSQVESRDQVETRLMLPRGLGLKIPLVSANMKTVTGPEMARKLIDLGGLAILHRFDEYDQIVENYRLAVENLPPLHMCSTDHGLVGVSIGIKKQDYELATEVYELGCRVLCVDVAHGDHTAVVDFVAGLREHCENACIIAGNIVTEGGAARLWEAGADIIKVGVGPGSLCTTRVETGNGYPQLSALDNVCNGWYRPRDDVGGAWQAPLFIADGGIKNAGDCVKALCFADLVMIGNLFAGTDEAPGDIITVNGQQFKSYVGSSTHKQRHVEGVIALVPYKGPVEGVVTRLVEGIKSGCSYQGVDNVAHLQQKPEFVVISNAGLTESHPHSVRL